MAVIAGIAATEVEGIYSMAGNMTRDFMGKLSGSKMEYERCKRRSK